MGESQSNSSSAQTLIQRVKHEGGVMALAIEGWIGPIQAQTIETLGIGLWSSLDFHFLE